MNRLAAIRRYLGAWGLILGVWCLLVLAFAGQLVFTSGMPWAQALQISARDWLPWVVLAPATAWLACQFPMERSRLALSLPVHLAACLLAVLFCQLLVRPGPPRPLPGSPPFRFRAEGNEEGPPFGPPGLRPEDRPRDRPLPAPAPEARRAFQINSQARFNIPIYWIIVSVVQALMFQRRSVERERKALELEASLTDAKLQALRMQLHPHFLFNTLNAISALLHSKPQAADEMIANLSELLRATLETSEQEIQLRRELDFLDRYLEIQQTRFGERLRIEKQVDAQALDGLVPTLILQPLVENALRHGIEPNPAPGWVVISARRLDAVLELTVRDSGDGSAKPAGQNEGIGLANTRARLAELYGPAGRLAITSASPGGYSVQLQIPYHENPSPHRG